MSYRDLEPPPAPREAAELLQRTHQRPAGGVCWSPAEQATRVVLAELERLQAMEKRVEECSTWCGLDGMHRAVIYIRTGEVPKLGRRFTEEESR